MHNAATHPSPQELSAFGLGQLSGAAAAAVASHLEDCRTCQKVVESAAPDSFLDKVRAAKPGGSSLPPGPPAAPRGAEANNLRDEAADTLKNLPPELANHAKYRIVRELGRGGMGVVYQAVQTLMDRTVAVKVINPSVLEHRDSLARFQAEVKAAAKLDHPHIVRAHDADQVGNLHLLVMEFVQGMNLADLVKEKGPLSIAHGCYFIRQAALGLQHAFEQGMVHRDIKPQNLMVTPKGQVKILDFGLARVRSERAQGRGLTDVGAFMGTPEYVAPEQATDARTADIRADLYSLGCTLYFLLTGRPPFQEDNFVKTVLAQIEKEPPPLHDLRVDVPVELSAVVVRLLAKDPAQRYQTPIELAQALVPFIKSGAKANVAALAASRPAMASPATGTVMGRDTSKMPGARQEQADKPAAPEAPAPAEAEPFKDLAVAAAAATNSRKTAKPAPSPWYRRPPVLAGVGTAVLALGFGIWLLAGVAFKTKVKTIEGEAFLVLEIDQPGAEVLVDPEKISVTVPGDNKPLEIQVEPGQHKLRISKDGFVAVTRDIELKTGKSDPIRVRLEPLPKSIPKDVPATVAAGAAVGASPGDPLPKTDPAPIKVGSPPPPAKELEALRRDKISPEALALAGGGDLNRAPASLVAVLGEARPIHTQRVSSLAFSSDGRWLASGSYDQTIILMDAETCRVNRVLKGHTGPVMSVAFSKDDKTLVSASRDGTLKLWPTDKDAEPVTVQLNLGAINAMAVSPDGRFVAAGAINGPIKLWKWGQWNAPVDIATSVHDVNPGWHPGWARADPLAFSPDSELLACGSKEGKPESPIRIYKTADGKLSQILAGHIDNVMGITFSRDGKYLVSCGGWDWKASNEKAKMWELPSGKLIAEFGPTRVAGAVGISQDGKTLALATDWFRLHLFDVPSRTRLRTFGGMFGGHTADPGGPIVFSPNGKLLAAGHANGSVYVWGTTNWEQKHLEHGHHHHVTALGVSADGRTVWSGGDDRTFRQWNLARPGENPVLRGFDGIVYSVACSPDGKTCAGAGSLWDATTGKELCNLVPRPEFQVFSPDGKTLAGACDSRVRLYDTILGRELYQFPPHGPEWPHLGSSGVAFNADGKLLAATSGKNGVKVWNVKSGAEFRTWTDSDMFAVAFSPDGQTFALGHGNGAITLWDLAEGKKIRTLGGHLSEVISLKFTPDGKRLVSSGADGTIRLWNPEQPRAREIIPLGPANRPLTFDLDPSGRYLFAAGNSPVIFVLRLP